MCVFWGLRIKAFVRRNAVLTIAVAAALVTMILVPPDAQYLDYFDLKTLSCLFCVLAVVCALKNVRFFYALARQIVRRFSTMRSCVLALVYITFIGSMLIANDMALLTFLPLGFLVLETTGKRQYMAFTFIMQNIAANLGGMLTPFGNPQNLYLYSRFGIPDAQFLTIMAPPFAVAIVLITACCLIGVKAEPLRLPEEPVTVDRKKTALYLVLFALSIAIVFRSIPYVIGLIVIPLVLMFVDRKALMMVDYPLLFTFVAFFVFAGNLSRLPMVHDLLSELLSRNTLLVSVLSCQCISNVPTAVLLSNFTTDYPSLLIGVNIGGAGTLIASLASLITYREYVKHNPDGKRTYIFKFSLYNFAFLAVLTAVSLALGY